MFPQVQLYHRGIRRNTIVLTFVIILKSILKKYFREVAEKHPIFLKISCRRCCCSAEIAEQNIDEKKLIFNFSIFKQKKKQYSLVLLNQKRIGNILRLLNRDPHIDYKTKIDSLRVQILSLDSYSCSSFLCFSKEAFVNQLHFPLEDIFFRTFSSQSGLLHVIMNSLPLSSVIDFLPSLLLIGFFNESRPFRRSTRTSYFSSPPVLKLNAEILQILDVTISKRFSASDNRFCFKYEEVCVFTSFS